MRLQSNTINDRWMYLCIQALLSNRLKPALMEEGKVQRLRQWVAEQRDGVRADVSDAELDEDPTLSSVELLSSPDQTEQVDVTIVSDEYEDDNDDDSDDEDEQEVSSYVPVARLAEAKGRSTLAVKESKMPWTDADIRHMIELRAQGFTHLETAVRLHHSSPSPPSPFLPPLLLDFSPPSSATTCLPGRGKKRKKKGIKQKKQKQFANERHFMTTKNRRVSVAAKAPSRTSTAA